MISALAQFLSVIFTPLLGLTLISAFLSWRIHRKTLPIAAVSPCIFLIVVIYTVLLGEWSVDLLIYRDAVFSVAPIAIGVLIFLNAQVLGFRADKLAKYQLIMLLSICAGLSIYLSVAAIQNYAMPHEMVEGKVAAIQHRLWRCCGWYALKINGQEYKITRDLLSTVSIGEHVQAEIGMGSDRIFALKKI